MAVVLFGGVGCLVVPLSTITMGAIFLVELCGVFMRRGGIYGNEQFYGGGPSIVTITVMLGGAAIAI